MSAQDSGIICMSITPFAMDGGLDEEAMRAHLGRMAAAEVGVVLGSLGTGEGHLLREAEIDRLYEIGVEELKGKVPVYGGAITFSGTDRMIEQARRGAASGLDAVQVYPPRPGPPGLLPTLLETERYYTDLLDAVGSPVIFTINPFVVPCEVPVPLIGRLVDSYPQIVSVYSAHGDRDYQQELIEAVGPKRPVSFGIGQLMRNLSAGGQGSVCNEPNVAPEFCVAVVRHFRSGEEAEAEEAYFRVMRLVGVLTKHWSPRSLKAALGVLGLPCGELRRPYLPVSDEARREIAEVLRQLDIKGTEGPE